MVECDYCDGSFKNEESYLAHLKDAHEGELGTIDQRRIEELESDESAIATGPVILGLVLAAAIGLVVYVTMFAGAGGGGDANAGGGSTDLPAHGDDAIISQVETEPVTGTNHVEPGTDIAYGREPPTSGTHYSTTVSAGFYEETKSYGALVHSLEHGAVVVYYDPAQLSASAEEDLKERAQRHTGPWQSFIAVPNPKANPESAYVLTAWTKRLTLDEYNPNAVDAFTAEYLGRGPENPVRSTEN